MPAFALASCTLCVSPCWTFSCTACGLSLSYLSVLVFEFVLKLLGYCSTLRDVDMENGRALKVRRVRVERMRVLRNMVWRFSLVELFGWSLDSW
jgi:cytochrome c oxidase assembly protein Cox11